MKENLIFFPLHFNFLEYLVKIQVSSSDFNVFTFVVTPQVFGSTKKRFCL